jgi:hypothetical protein
MLEEILGQLDLGNDAAYAHKIDKHAALSIFAADISLLILSTTFRSL